MTDEASVRKVPAPLVNPETQPYFEATGQGRLIYKHCGACDLPHHPPRNTCPHCHADGTQWRTSKGLGEVYSASRLRRGVAVPYCIGYVTLDEGVTVMSDLVDFGDATPTVGTRVQVRFVDTDGGAPVPMFGPVQPA